MLNQMPVTCNRSLSHWVTSCDFQNSSSFLAPAFLAPLQASTLGGRGLPHPELRGAPGDAPVAHLSTLASEKTKDPIDEISGLVILGGGPVALQASSRVTRGSERGFLRVFSFHLLPKKTPVRTRRSARYVSRPNLVHHPSPTRRHLRSRMNRSASVRRRPSRWDRSIGRIGGGRDEPTPTGAAAKNRRTGLSEGLDRGHPKRPETEGTEVDTLGLDADPLDGVDVNRAPGTYRG